MARYSAILVAFVFVAGLCWLAWGCGGQAPTAGPSAIAPGQERARGAGGPADDMWAGLDGPLTGGDIAQIVEGRRKPPEIMRGQAQNLAALASLGPVQADPNRQWTVLVYLNGDCNLEDSILGDFNEMEAAIPGRGVEVIALLDRAKGYDKSDGDWTDARVFRMKRDADLGKIGSPVLAGPGELDLGDPKVLATFVAAGMRTFPARHYALLMGAHGAGWAGMIADEDPAGRRDGGIMSIRELRAALSGAMKSVARPRLDLLSLDLCLMGQFELSVELDGLVDVIVASEASVPGHGQPYEKIMPMFATGGSAKEIGAGMVKAFGQLCDKEGDRRATLSALDVSQTADTARAFNAVLAKYAPTVAAQWPQFARSMFYAESYVSRTDFRRGRNACASIDADDMLKRFARHVAGSPATAEQALFDQQLAKYLIATYAGKGRRLSTGLSIYAPFRPDMLNPDYGQIRFASSCKWLELLGSLHGTQRQKLSPPKIAAVRLVDRQGNKINELNVAGSQSFEITVEGNNILWTIVSVVQRVERAGGYVVFSRAFVPDLNFDERRKKAAAEAANLADLLMPQYVDGTNVLRTPALGMHYRLTNGQQVVGATMDYTDPTDVRHCVVPAVYSHPSVGQVSAELSVDVNWLTVDGITGYSPTPNGRMIPFPIRPKPDAQITPYYAVEMATGQRSYLPAGTLSFGRGLKLLPFLFEPGDYALIAEAESIGGSSTRKVFSFPIKGSERLSRWTQAAGRFSGMDLAGDWAWSIGTLDPNSKQYEYKPTGLTWTFKTDPKYPESPDFELRGKDVDLRGFATVNTKYLPHINVFTKVDPTKADAMAQEFLSPEDRGFARTDFFVAFLVRQEKETQLVLWDPVNAIMSRAVRAGKAPAASAAAPAGGANLAGRWQIASGSLVQVLTGNTYETYRGGKLVDKGTYLVEGDRIITRSASGKVDTETFSMPDKDTLVIHGASGGRTVLKRVLAPTQATPPAGAKALVGSWGSADGKVVIVLTETTYKNVVNGRETETGTYKVQGNCITTTSSAGKTETQTFTLAGDALTITGQDGKPSVFQRR